jgi:threonine synthase
MASGSLCTKVDKAIKEFIKLGLIEDNGTAVYGAQATGCSPIAKSVKDGTDMIHPVHADTIAKSLAIGNPADGYYANRVIRDSGGWAEDVSDDEVVAAMKLLAETEGIFAETAGGVTLGCARKLIESGKLPRDESIVLCITGNGLKTIEAVADNITKPRIINASLKEFDVLAEADGVK